MAERQRFSCCSWQACGLASRQGGGSADAEVMPVETVMTSAARTIPAGVIKLRRFICPPTWRPVLRSVHPDP